MKYLTILFVLFSLCSASFAQEKVETTQPTVNSIIDKVTSKLGDGFKIAKDEVKPLAEGTVRQYVAQQSFFGKACLSIFIFCLVMLVVGLVLFLVGTSKKNDAIQGLGAIGMFLGIVGMFISALNVYFCTYWSKLLC
jgi:hypothetical protein